MNRKGSKGLLRLLGLMTVFGMSAVLAGSSTVLQWTETSPSTGSPLTQVIYAGGRYIAVGTGIIMESTDGVNWTTVYQPTQSFDAQTIAYGNGVYVAGGSIFVDDGSGQNISVQTGTWVTSKDGVHWTPTSFSSAPGSEIVFGNGQFTMVGTTCGENTGVQIQPDETFFCLTSGIDTSSDGKTWITHAPVTGETPFLPKSLGFADGQFLSMYNSDDAHVTAYVSSDAVSWTPTSTFVSTAGFTEFRVTGDTVSAVGSDGIHPVVAISKDGSNWTASQFDWTAGQGARFHGAFTDIVRYGNGYLATFNGVTAVPGEAKPGNEDQLVMSPDGKNWCFLDGFPSADKAVSLAGTGGQVVTASDDGAIFSTPAAANADATLSCDGGDFIPNTSSSTPVDAGGSSSGGGSGDVGLLTLAELLGLAALKRSMGRG